MLAKPLDFGDLSLDDRNYIDDDLRSPISNEARLMEMLAAQAAHSADPGFGDEDTIAADEKVPDEKKREMLQKSLNMAASNGDVERIQKILGGKARDFVDINGPDEDGTPALIYASCFVCLPSFHCPLVPLYALSSITRGFYLLFSFYLSAKAFSRYIPASGIADQYRYSRAMRV